MLVCISTIVKKESLIEKFFVVLRYSYTLWMGFTLNTLSCGHCLPIYKESSHLPYKWFHLVYDSIFRLIWGLLTFICLNPDLRTLFTVVTQTNLRTRSKESQNHNFTTPTFYSHFPVLTVLVSIPPKTLHVSSLFSSYWDFTLGLVNFLTLEMNDFILSDSSPCKSLSFSSSSR